MVNFLFRKNCYFLWNFGKDWTAKKSHEIIFDIIVRGGDLAIAKIWYGWELGCLYKKSVPNFYLW